MGKLTDKVVIITGASGGVGAASAALFSREGAKLVLVGRDEARLTAAAAACDPERTRAVVADASDPAQIAQFVETAVSAFGGIDVLFANAGSEGKIAPIVSLDLEEYDRLHAVNSRGPFVAMQRVIPHLLARGGGTILFTSSTGAVTSFPGVSAYAMSKAGLLALVRCAASELASVGIRVNALVLGGIDNRMSQSLMEQMAPGNVAALYAQFAQGIPARRLGTNEDAAKAALFLACDDSSYCYGTSLVVDGGLTVI